MTDKEQLREKLHAAHRRMTRQRQLVLDTLAKGREHPDVDSLFRQVKAREPNISVATVYRTLTVLKEMGLIEEHRFGENHSHFEIAHAAPHYHFTCLKCGQVLEFEAPQVMQVAHQLSKREELHITSAHLFLSGHCAKCLEKSEAK